MVRNRAPSATRQILIDAAFEEIHEKGFQGASLDDILARTGVTKGALYHHFPNKLALGYAVVEEKLGQALTQSFLLPVQGSTDPITTLTRTIRGMAAGMSDESVCLGCPIANLAQEMSPVDEGFRTRIDGLYSLWRSAVADLLERGKAGGTVRRDVDAAAAAAFVVSAVAGSRVVGKSARDRKVIAGCLDELCGYLETLRAPAPGRRNRASASRV